MTRGPGRRGVVVERERTRRQHSGALSALGRLSHGAQQEPCYRLPALRLSTSRAFVVIVRAATPAIPMATQSSGVHSNSAAAENTDPPFSLVSSN